jgi:hypothetical protein
VVIQAAPGGGVMNDIVTTQEGGSRATAVPLLDRLEKLYLAATRILALAGATALLLWAAWFIISGAYKSSRNAASVVEAPAGVTADELLNVDLKPAVEQGRASAGENAAKVTAQRYYRDFLGRYYGLYSSRFAPFRQASDEPLTKAAFDQRFVQSSDRIERVANGDMSLATDKADLEALSKAMTEVAAAKATGDRLSAYKRAKRRQVTRTIRSTRTETFCEDYGYYIDMCLSYGSREVPGVRRVTESRLPEGVISPPDLFGAYQEKFWTLLNERREANAAKARTERAEIVEGNAVGTARLWMAAYIVGGFVSVMLLFLLIAIERHQRRIARALPIE